MDDSRHMKCALGLARRVLGSVWPNPAVGCILVRHDDGFERIVGRGHTSRGGRPHAETVALEEAGPQAKGATAYVTLEPCAHHGRTGPCAAALIEAGIARAVIAVKDPDPRVNGAGIARLKAAGIEVAVGVLEKEAQDVNAGYLMRVTKGRPLFALKIATSLDGRIASAGGASQWITGAPARDRAHLLRARYDAVLIGAGTARADDPALTCRLEGLGDSQPVRIVLDAKADLSSDLRLFRETDAVPTWWAVGDTVPAEKLAKLAEAGLENVEFLRLATKAGRIDIKALGQELGHRGITRVLVEGGGEVAASFLKASLVDRLFWFRAGMVLGGDGLAAIAGLGVKALELAPRFKRTAVIAAGDDLVECFEAEDPKTMAAN